MQKKFHVAELVRSGRQCQKQKRNPSREGGRYYPCDRKVKNHYIYSKVRFQYRGKDENQKGADCWPQKRRRQK